MRVLLDTCTFLWMIEDPKRLSQRAREVLIDPGTDVFLSVVSVWEMILKHSIGRLPLVEPAAAFIQAQRIAHGLESLPLDEESALHLSRLPAMHKDPFDRMLICQSIVHGVALATPDHLVTQYSVRTLW